MSAPICDFDSSPDVVWRYPAEDFDEPGTDWGSAGDWAACDPCSELIEADDWEALADRTVVGAPFYREAIRARLLVMWRSFAAHRTGDRVPWPT